MQNTGKQKPAMPARTLNDRVGAGGSASTNTVVQCLLWHAKPFCGGEGWYVLGVKALRQKGFGAWKGILVLG